MINKKEKRTCRNPGHPFKQDWYYYKEDLDDPNYCSSCASYLNFLRDVLSVAIVPRPTLYGDSIIKTSPEQMKRLIDEVYDGR